MLVNSALERQRQNRETEVSHGTSRGLQKVVL